MAVAPKGVAQNLVSVFLEMARCVCTRRRRIACYAAQSPPAGIARAATEREAATRAARRTLCRRRGGCVRFSTRFGGKTLPGDVGCAFSAGSNASRSLSAQWADPRKSGAFYAGLTPTLAGIIPYSVRSCFVIRPRCDARGSRIGAQGTTWATYETLKERMLRARCVARGYVPPAHMHDAGFPLCAGACRRTRTCRPCPPRWRAVSRAFAGRR